MANRADGCRCWCSRCCSFWTANLGGVKRTRRSQHPATASNIRMCFLISNPSIWCDLLGPRLAHTCCAGSERYDRRLPLLTQARTPRHDGGAVERRLLLDEDPVEDVGDDQVRHDHDRKDEPRDEVDSRPVVADRHRFTHDDVPVVDDEQLEEGHKRGAKVVEVVEGVRDVWLPGHVGADTATEDDDAELRVDVEEGP
eukprot:scaffold639_cov65-Phaeocystis_antarctica.AAC.2